MRLRELKRGTVISDALRVESPLDSHNGIATYLAEDSECGHVLLHLFPEFDENSLPKIENAVAFQRNVLHNVSRGGRYEEFLYFSEPFPLGEFLFEWLERRERVSVPEAIKRVLKILQILQQAHETGLYHGRITPKSILMERSSDAFALRLMGLGLSQSLTESMRLDIDWFDYTFDLEGMTPQAVDIYGIAIILMGLVSSESGIDSFEATGLLPPCLQGGILQQAMERALALRIDAYTDALSFSLDLEAALLELDAKQGEVYVGDLVGYESAIKSISSISEDHRVISENSGVWSSLVDTLEQEERSSLLCSLTSLTCIKSGEDEDDEDVTRVSSVPQAVLGLRRIRTTHVSSDDSTQTAATPTPDDDAHSDAPSHEKTEISAHPMPANRMAELQSLEAELASDDADTDDSPTRVIQRPNYVSIRFTEENASAPEGVSSSIAAVLEATAVPVPAETPIQAMQKRILAADVIQHECTLNPDVQYPEEPCDEDNPPSDDAQNHDAPSPDVPPPAPVQPTPATPSPKGFSASQRRVLFILIVVIILLAIVALCKSLLSHA